MQAIGRFASLFPASLSDLVHAFLPALTAFLGDPPPDTTRIYLPILNKNYLALRPF